MKGEEFVKKKVANGGQYCREVPTQAQGQPLDFEIWRLFLSRMRAISVVCWGSETRLQ